ncbi:MAG: hypothetical protein FJ095_12615 [Deltaproteobacteria bacterium]|nr:hypothetical protein [Deltaproteobacteria bacterium]
MWLADEKFLAAAFVLHLALPVAALMAPNPSLRRANVRAALTTEIEVDVSSPPAPELPEEAFPREPREPDDARVPDERSEPSAEAPAGDEVPVERDVPEEVTRGAETSPDSFPSPEPGEVDPMKRPPSQYEVGGPGIGIPGLQGLPLGAVPPERVERNPAPTETQKRTYEVEAARRSIDKGIRVKDAQLGLDFPAASAIAAILRDAVRGSDAPFECQGSFSVTVGPAGKVTSVSLGGFAGGDPGTWQLIRKSALAMLSARVFEMKSSFVRGALVGVTIRSEHKMPGGGVNRQGATFSFDVSDVGAKPVRVVSMSFSAKPLD